MKLDRLELWSRIASVGLTTVLVVSASYGFVATAATTHAAVEATRASSLNESFRAARYAVGAEESLERKYRLEPGPAVLMEHRASGAALLRAMAAVIDKGDASDRTAASDVERLHGKYAAATRLMFSAVDRADVRAVIALDHGVVDPVFGRVQSIVDRRAAAHAAGAKVSLRQLYDTQEDVVHVTIALAVLGLVSLGVFLTVLALYKKRVAVAHSVELRTFEEAALVDNLTGIGNHRAYKDAFEREVSRAKRHAEPLSLALLDIDDFKVINDRDGHLQGDRVLATLASLLKSLRAEDGAYRVGGDEFAIVLPHTTAVEARESMERLLVAVHLALRGGTVSIGLATATGDDCDIETLQAQADAALYATKRSGRNRVTAFDSTLDDMWFLSPAKINNLQRLIATGSVRTVFQPIWDIDRCSVLAYEALSRLDPAYGFPGPQDAFDLAERIGRAHELDAACRNAALLRGRDLPPGALLFINVSPQSLDHGRLDAGAFAAQVRAAGLEPDRVVIEITERSITQVAAVIEAARALQREGFRLALDDTGAGNSGLEMLSRLPVEFVKIDRELIVKAVDNNNARAVIAGIVAIAQATGAYVIAEGIETTQLLSFVCGVGSAAMGPQRRAIQGVQGYLLVRPNDAFVGSPQTDDAQAVLREFSLDTAAGRINDPSRA